MAGPEKALAWSGVVAEVGRARQAVFVALIAEGGAWERMPGHAVREAVASLARGKQFMTRWYCLLLEWKRGISAEYVRAGFELTGDAWLTPRGDCRADPVSRIRAITGVSPRLLWSECADRPDFVARLENDIWDCLTPDERWEYYFTCLSPRTQAETVDAVNATIRGAEPASRGKAIAFLGEVLESRRGLPKLRTRMQPALGFIARLCRPPPDPEEIWQRAIIALIGLVPDERLGEFLQISDASLLRIEKACRRGNDESRIARGITAFFRVHPHFTLDRLPESPKNS